MHHPFDGIAVPAKPERTAHRRNWLKGLLGAFAGLFVWNRAGAQLPPPGIIRRPVVVNPNDPEPFDHNPSTAVRGEEGASVGAGSPDGPVLTLAINEAGGGPVTRAFPEGGRTTAALREEGAGGPVTKAKGEAGKMPGKATTLAAREEGAKR